MTDVISTRKWTDQRSSRAGEFIGPVSRTTGDGTWGSGILIELDNGFLVMISNGFGGGWGSAQYLDLDVFALVDDQMVRTDYQRILAPGPAGVFSGTDNTAGCALPGGRGLATTQWADFPVTTSIVPVYSFQVDNGGRLTITGSAELPILYVDPGFSSPEWYQSFAFPLSSTKAVVVAFDAGHSGGTNPPNSIYFYPLTVDTMALGTPVIINQTSIRNSGGSPLAGGGVLFQVQGHTYYIYASASDVMHFVDVTNIHPVLGENGNMQNGTPGALRGRTYFVGQVGSAANMLYEFSGDLAGNVALVRSAAVPAVNIPFDYYNFNYCGYGTSGLFLDADGVLWLGTMIPYQYPAAQMTVHLYRDPFNNSVDSEYNIDLPPYAAWGMQVSYSAPDRFVLTGLAGRAGVHAVVLYDGFESTLSGWLGPLTDLVDGGGTAVVRFF